MRGKICIFVAALAALLALQGCMRRDAVIFQGISDVEVSMEASPRVGVVLLVENTSGKNITVRDASFVLTSRDGGRIAKARVEGELYLPKRCRTELYVPLQCSLDNPLKALAVFGRHRGKCAAALRNGRRDGEGRMPEENVRSGEDASVGVSEVFRGKRIVLSRRLNCVL